MQTTNVEKFLYSRKEAAYSLGISTRSVDYLISKKELETRHMGTKVLITRESLRRWAAGNHPEAISTKIPREMLKVAA
jgi:excisionase family DNA binding protein